MSRQTTRFLGLFMTATIGLAMSLSGCSLLRSGGSQLQATVEEYSGELPPDFPQAVPLYNGRIESGSRTVQGSSVLWIAVISTDTLDPRPLVETSLRLSGYSVSNHIGEQGILARNIDYIVEIFFTDR